MAKKHHAEEHVNHERWLVSYADFITLLFAFFVVLFSSAQVDSSKSQAMSVAMERSFERFSIFKYVTGDEIGQSNSGSASGNSKKFRDYLMKSDEGVPLMVATAVKDPDVVPTVVSDMVNERNLKEESSQKIIELEKLSSIQMQIMALMEENKNEKNMEVKREERGVVISLKEAALFENGKSEISAKMVPFLSSIGYILKTVPNYVRVEGFASEKSNKDAWTQSAQRTASVIRWLTNSAGIEGERFIAISYGNGRKTNLTNIALNDRVDIVVMNHQDEKYR